MHKHNFLIEATRYTGGFDLHLISDIRLSQTLWVG